MADGHSKILVILKIKQIIVIVQEYMDEIFSPLNIWYIYVSDIQTHCATLNEYISEVHDTIQITICTYL